MIRTQVTKRVLAGAGAAALAVGALAGCSQVASLGPVSGAAANTMQIATDNILIANKINVLEGVRCTQSSTKETECKGKTVDGQVIVSTGTAPISESHSMTPGGEPTVASNGLLDIQMVVKVGDKTIYKGPAQKILDEGAVK